MQHHFSSPHFNEPMLELPDRKKVEIADIVLRHKSGGLTFVQVKAGNAGNISSNSGNYSDITRQIENTFKYASQMEFQNSKSVFPSTNARRPHISVMFCFDSVSPDVARFIQREAKKHPNVHFEFQRDFKFNRTIVGQ